jgi:hypothetical protein
MLLVFANVFIAFCVASVVFLQLFTLRIASKESALPAALIAGIIVHFYIDYNHKMHRYIASKDNE